jgi:hypothetical protein
VTSAVPPKLAAWLLYHQVRGYHAESLAGDLTEEYARGRGDGWYWRQVLCAVTASYYRTLRLYGLRLVAAVAVGWCALIVGVLILEWLWPPVSHGIAWTLLAGCIDVVGGRLVVGIYRAHPRFVTGVFAVSILLYRLPFIYELVIRTAGDPKNIPHFTQELAATVFWMACAWCGGLWQRHIDINATKR